MPVEKGKASGLYPTPEGCWVFCNLGVALFTTGMYSFHMTHIHTLRSDVPRSTRMFCEGCDIVLRLADYDEATFVHDTDGFLPDGPILWNNNIVVVPLHFSLFQEA